MDDNISINDINAFKKTIVYTYLGKRIEEELTYEKFIELLNGNGEFFFNYGDITIDFAYHHEKNNKIWEVNINGYESDAEHQYYNSVAELESNTRICGKTIAEIWDELTD